MNNRLTLSGLSKLRLLSLDRPSFTKLKMFKQTIVFAIVLLQFGFVLPVFAQDLSRKIFFELNNQSLNVGLDKLAKMYGLRVSYLTTDISKYDNITIEKGTRTAEETLKLLLSNTTLSFIVKDKSILVVEKVAPKTTPDNRQRNVASGVITDSENNPLIGVTIRVKGENRGVISNSKGEFQIEAQDGSVLALSFIGFVPQEVAVNSQKNIHVYLVDDFTMLGEVSVVSTGYQTIPKERATGSFSTVSAADLAKTPTVNLVDRIEGQVAGVKVTSAGALQIRGKNSYSTKIESDPLIVIDGFPYLPIGGENVLESLNPDDVEQMTFLKDAAAASIWGAKAANGVVVITTKKGSKRNNASVNFSTALTTSGGPKLNYLKQMTTAQYIDLEKEMVEKGFIAEPTNIYNSGLGNVSQAETILFKYKHGTITSAQRDEALGQLATINNTSQIQDNLLQKATTQQYNLSLSGGNDNSTYYVSGNYYTDHPIYKGNINRGYSIMMNNTTNLFKKRLTVTTGLNFNSTNDQSNSSAMTAIGNTNMSLRPYDLLIDGNGNSSQYYIRSTSSVLKNYESLGYLPWTYSPVDELNYSNTKTNTNNARLNLALNGKVTDWLNLEVSGMAERKFGETVLSNELESYAVRNLINNATSIDPVKKTLVYGVPMGGYLNSSFANGRSYSLRGQFNINKVFNNIHRISMIGGAEIRETYAKSWGQARYGYSSDTGTDQAYNPTVYYTTITGGTSQIGNTSAPLVETTERFLSYYSNASYSLKDKYIISGSARFDDYNLLGVSRRKRAIPLWSTGAKWNIYNEDFMKEISWIDQLALRLTYGFNGNAPRNLTNVSLITLSSSASTDTGRASATIDTPANPDLGWEKTKVVNYAVDFSLFKRRLSGSAELYFKNTTDIITSMPINGTHGFTTFYYNTGTMQSNGVDVNISGLPITSKDWSWTSSFNFAYNTNKISDSRFANITASTAMGSGTPYNGYPIDYLFVYRWAGLDNTGLSQVYNKDNQIVNSKTAVTNIKDLKYAGRRTAPYFGGFTNAIRYKSFELSALITYSFGSVFLKPSIDNYLAAKTFTGFIGKQEDLALRWRKVGDELTTNVPGLVGGNYQGTSVNRYKYSDILVRDGSYIRLRQIALSYNLPSKMLVGTIFRNVSISGVVRNLGLLWTANKDGLDPEYLSASTTLNSLPPSPTYTLKLSVSL